MKPIPDSVRPMWDAYQAHRGADLGARFYESFYFGDSEPLADELADLVLAGIKRASAGLVWGLQAQGDAGPRPGDLSIMTNWAGEPLGIIETLSVEQVAYQDVSAEFAATEGEGDGSLAWWREAHWAYFGRECARLGLTPSPTMPVLCERFRLVWPL
jgi:uncharacterized protein YhfF